MSGQVLILCGSYSSSSYEISAQASKFLMAEWLRRWHLRDMKCTVHELEVMSLNPNQIEGGVRSTSKSYLNKKYQLHQSICMRACAFDITSDLRKRSGTFLS